MKKTFFGRIPAKYEDRDRKLLRGLGVQGCMFFREGGFLPPYKVSFFFDLCEIDLETAERLREFYPLFNPKLFTAYDEDFHLLDREEQDLWDWD